MRILILSQYFDPEPILKGLPFAKELVRQGHEVEVLTTFPSYPGGRIYPGYRLRVLQRETLDGIRVIRVPLYPSHDSGSLRRTITYASFALAAALLGPWVVNKPDVIYALHGNATVALPAWIIGMTRRAPFVLDVQDLWPDSIVSSGMLPSRFKRLIPLVDSFCRFMYRRASRIVVLSEGFRRILLDRGVPDSKLKVIHNWCDEVQTAEGILPPQEATLMEGHFNVVMAGNMGRMQGLDIVIDAAAQLLARHPRVRFLLVGGGVDRDRLEERARSLGLSNVHFLPRRPPAEIGAILHRADALLVHLKDESLFSITIPSRIQAYLAVGRPILCGVRGDGASLVLQAGAGLCFEPDNEESLVEAIEKLLGLPELDRQLMGDHGRQFYRSRLSVTEGTRAFIDLFQQACLAPNHD